jgi:hypothetical protein
MKPNDQEIRFNYQKIKKQDKQKREMKKDNKK